MFAQLIKLQISHYADSEILFPCVSLNMNTIEKYLKWIFKMSLRPVFYFIYQFICVKTCSKNLVLSYLRVR